MRQITWFVWVPDSVFLFLFFFFITKKRGGRKILLHYVFISFSCFAFYYYSFQYVYFVFFSCGVSILCGVRINYVWKPIFPASSNPILILSLCLCFNHWTFYIDLLYCHPQASCIYVSCPPFHIYSCSYRACLYFFFLCCLSLPQRHGGRSTRI